MKQRGMTVAVGAALFVFAPLQAGMAVADVSRVVQGVATGIGFVGAGAILKLGDERVVQGLTTAASVWLTAAIGVAVGLGRVWSGILSTFLALVILTLLGRFERWAERGNNRR